MEYKIDNVVLTEEQAKKIHRQVEDSKKNTKSIWNMKDGDEYLCLHSGGSITLCIYDDFPADWETINSGNAFLTKEEAEQERDRRKALQSIKKYMWENGIREKGEESCCEIITKYSKLDYVYMDIKWYNKFLLSVDTEENAKKLIKDKEKELKIYFGINA